MHTDANRVFFIHSSQNLEANSDILQEVDCNENYGTSRQHYRTEVQDIKGT